jgi:hypothetical protein
MSWKTGLAAALLTAVASIPFAIARDDAKSIDGDGFIKVWVMLAPIPLADGESQADAIDKEKIKGEGDLDPKEGDKVKVGNKELTWKKQTAEDYYFDFNKLIGEVTEQQVGYAVTTVVSGEEVKNVTLKIGSDDGCKIWLNGKEVGKDTSDRALEKDQNDFDGLTLKKGANVLVIKVGNGIADWTGCARFTDKAGKPIAGLKVELKK